MALSWVIFILYPEYEDVHIENNILQIPSALHHRRKCRGESRIWNGGGGGGVVITGGARFMLDHLF